MYLKIKYFVKLFKYKYTAQILLKKYLNTFKYKCIRPHICSMLWINSSK